MAELILESTNATAIWQEAPEVAALWADRRHFGGWAIICMCLRMLMEIDLFADPANDHVTSALDRKLADHGPPPIGFRIAWLRDCLRIWARWDKEPDREQREWHRRRFVSANAMLASLRVPGAISAGVAR